MKVFKYTLGLFLLYIFAQMVFGLFLSLFSSDDGVEDEVQSEIRNEIYSHYISGLRMKIPAGWQTLAEEESQRKSAAPQNTEDSVLAALNQAADLSLTKGGENTLHYTTREIDSQPLAEVANNLFRLLLESFHQSAQQKQGRMAHQQRVDEVAGIPFQILELKVSDKNGKTLIYNMTYLGQRGPHLHFFSAICTTAENCKEVRETLQGIRFEGEGASTKP